MTKVVVLDEPLNWTTEFVTKFDPFTVKINWASPTVFDVGEMLVVTGVGLFIVKV